MNKDTVAAHLQDLDTRMSAAIANRDWDTVTRLAPSLKHADKVLAQIGPDANWTDAMLGRCGQIR